MKVGKALRAVKSVYGFTNCALARASGVGRATIGKLIREEQDSASWDLLERLAAGLERIHPLARGTFLYALQLSYTAQLPLADPRVEPNSTDEFTKAVLGFVDAFQLVFDHDWDMTKNCISDSKFLIDKRGTFIDPRVEDESNNWANRGCLLKMYRELIIILATGNYVDESGNVREVCNLPSESSQFW